MPEDTGALTVTTSPGKENFALSYMESATTSVLTDLTAGCAFKGGASEEGDDDTGDGNTDEGDGNSDVDGDG